MITLIIIGCQLLLLKPASWAPPLMGSCIHRRLCPAQLITWLSTLPCLDEGKLALQYVEQLRVNRIETETIDVCSINIARESNETGQLEWMERPGNWVLREGATGSDLCYQNGQWQ